MISTRAVTHVGVLCLAILAGAGAVVGHARPVPLGRDDTAPAATATGGQCSMASVDIEQVYSSSGAPEELNRKAEEVEHDAQDRLNAITAVRLLEINELQEYIELVGKLQPAPADTARLAALKKISDDRQAEFDALSVKPQAQLVAADKARLKELADISHVVDKVLPNIQESFQNDIRERLAAFKHEQIIKLRAIIGQVAKEKGVEHVFDVNAMLYSSSDLTSAVLQKLSKRAAK